MTCDDLAKKCKAGDKKACELYKKKCGKVIFLKLWRSIFRSHYNSIYLCNYSMIISFLKLQDDGKKYCEAAAKKCKAGDDKSCELYKAKCEGVR